MFAHKRGNTFPVVDEIPGQRNEPNDHDDVEISEAPRMAFASSPEQERQR
ncbi:MAG: hypothetical protein ACXVH8_06585 [Halobacteriota archaeon]